MLVFEEDFAGNLLLEFQAKENICLKLALHIAFQKSLGKLKEKMDWWPQKGVSIINLPPQKGDEHSKHLWNH